MMVCDIKMADIARPFSTFANIALTWRWSGSSWTTVPTVEFPMARTLRRPVIGTLIQPRPQPLHSHSREKFASKATRPDWKSISCHTRKHTSGMGTRRIAWSSSWTPRWSDRSRIASSYPEPHRMIALGCFQHNRSGLFDKGVPSRMQYTLNERHEVHRAIREVPVAIKLLETDAIMRQKDKHARMPP